MSKQYNASAPTAVPRRDSSPPNRDGVFIVFVRDRAHTFVPEVPAAAEHRTLGTQCDARSCHQLALLDRLGDDSLGGDTSARAPAGALYIVVDLELRA